MSHHSRSQSPMRLRATDKSTLCLAHSLLPLAQKLLYAHLPWDMSAISGSSDLSSTLPDVQPDRLSTSQHTSHQTSHQWTSTKSSLPNSTRLLVSKSCTENDVSLLPSSTLLHSPLLFSTSSSTHTLPLTIHHHNRHHRILLLLFHLALLTMVNYAQGFSIGTVLANVNSTNGTNLNLPLPSPPYNLDTENRITLDHSKTSKEFSNDLEDHNHHNHQTLPLKPRAQLPQDDFQSAKIEIYRDQSSVQNNMTTEPVEQSPRIRLPLYVGNNGRWQPHPQLVPPKTLTTASFSSLSSRLSSSSNFLDPSNALSSFAGSFNSRPYFINFTKYLKSGGSKATTVPTKIQKKYIFIDKRPPQSQRQGKSLTTTSTSTSTAKIVTTPTFAPTTTTTTTTTTERHRAKKKKTLVKVKLVNGQKQFLVYDKLTTLSPVTTTTTTTTETPTTTTTTETPTSTTTTETPTTTTSTETPTATTTETPTTTTTTELASSTTTTTDYDEDGDMEQILRKRSDQFHSTDNSVDLFDLAESSTMQSIDVTTTTTSPIPELNITTTTQATTTTTTTTQPPPITSTELNLVTDPSTTEMYDEGTATSGSTTWFPTNEYITEPTPTSSDEPSITSFETTRVPSSAMTNYRRCYFNLTSLCPNRSSMDLMDSSSMESTECYGSGVIQCRNDESRCALVIDDDDDDGANDDNELDEQNQPTGYVGGYFFCTSPIRIGNLCNSGSVRCVPKLGSQSSLITALSTTVGPDLVEEPSGRVETTNSLNEMIIARHLKDKQSSPVSTTTPNKARLSRLQVGLIGGLITIGCAIFVLVAILAYISWNRLKIGPVSGPTTCGGSESGVVTGAVRMNSQDSSHVEQQDVQPSENL